MPPVSVLVKPASGLCNMNCSYCFYRDEISRRDQPPLEIMSDSTLKNVIRKTLLNADGTIHYLFQGGEPTLAGIPFFEKVLEFQKKYNKKGISVYNAIQTNGLLIDEQWCRFFVEHQFLVGLSIDGTREIHDLWRTDASGSGTFEQVFRAAKLLDQFTVPYNILTVVTPQIAENIEAIYSYYKKMGWSYQQYIACLDPLDDATDNAFSSKTNNLNNDEHCDAFSNTPVDSPDDVRSEDAASASAHAQTQPWSLSPKLYGQFLIGLFRLWNKDFKTGHAPFIQPFEDYAAIANGHRGVSCNRQGICSIQQAVEANGDVYPCDFYMLDKYLLGNFNENSFAQIQQKRCDIHFIERSHQLTDACRSCQFHWICKGGCQRCRDYNPSARAWENRFCESYRMFFEACLEEICLDCSVAPGI